MVGGRKKIQNCFVFPFMTPFEICFNLTIYQILNFIKRFNCALLKNWIPDINFIGAQFGSQLKREFKNKNIWNLSFFLVFLISNIYFLKERGY